MIRKSLSLFGIVAVVAFFLPWLKACNEVQSGFSLLILDSIKDFSVNSLSSLNTGFILMAVPAYAVLSVWLAKSLAAERFFKITFGALSFLSLVNVGVWGGMMISMIIEEWGTPQHTHAMLMAKFAGIVLLGTVFLIVYLFRWIRTRKIDHPWSEFVLIFPLLGIVGIAYTFEPNYYGVWLYLGSLAVLTVSAVIGGVKGLKTSQGPSPA
jgi:glucan phosphoethanolaminetransferase (alkaline phosphatase superfamily)